MLRQYPAQKSSLIALAAFQILCASAGEALAATPQIAMAPDHTVLLKADGSVWHWGVIDYEVMSSSGSSTCYASGTRKSAPVPVSNLSGVIAVAATGKYSLALKGDGTVWQWGLDQQMVTNCQVGQFSKALWQVADASGPLANVTAIWARSGSFFARKADGTLWAWGDNEMNKLGAILPALSSKSVKPPASIQNVAQPVPVDLLKTSPAGSWPPATPPLAVASGGTHTLALLFDGGVLAWGGAQYGERGNGSYGPTANSYWNGYVWYDRAATSSISGVGSIAAGLYKSAAVKNDGTLWVWGCNENGELGDAIPMGSHVSVLCQRNPLPISNFTGVAAVAMGVSHTTMLKADGSVWGMGYNGGGRLAADNSLVRSLVPIPIQGLSNVTAIDAAGDCSVAMRNDGAVFEWGINCPGMQNPSVQVVPINVGSVASAPACGAANGRSFSSMPSANLCLIGAASAVSGSGPWSWNCGPVGGASIACAAGNGPVFVLNPSSMKVLPLRTVTLRAIAQGSGTLSYQWYKTNAAGTTVQLVDIRGMKTKLGTRTGIAGSQTAQLTLSGVQASDTGAYYVVAKDQNGVSAQSKSAQLNVMAVIGPTRPELIGY